MPRGRFAVSLAAGLAVLATLTGGGYAASSIADVADVADVAGVARAAPTGDSAAWLDGGPDSGSIGGPGTVRSSSQLNGRVELAEAADEVRITFEHARVVRIPDACAPSTVTSLRSAIVGSDLVCVPLPGVDAVPFTVVVVGRPGEEVGARVTTTRGPEEQSSDFPERVISGGEPTITPDVRLISSPDFLNGDVGDLADGPGFWSSMAPGTRSANSTNEAYDTAVDRILDDWQGLDPAGVLVAGDLTDGRWGYDDQDSGNFGPVGTRAERRLAVQRAARTYYPQWQQRFADHGLGVYPAMGDHEYGDDPWPRRKRLLAADFKAEFARTFTTHAAGKPLFADHPKGPARLTAYAGRPSPELQVVTLDVFDITEERARIKVDPQQTRWLRQVLRRAQRDDVEWIVVQGHTPILGPVRSLASSRLSYPGAADSRLWKIFKRFGVDLYLTGEVHDTTATQADGIVQISHGGIFQFSLTTALVLDVYGDRMYLTLRDYAMSHSHDPATPRLWETRRGGMPSHLEVGEVVSTIGTASLVSRARKGASLSAPSGILVPPPAEG